MMKVNDTDKSNWQTVHFGDMVHHISERVQPDDVTVDRYVGLEHLDPESLKIRRWGTPDEVGATKLRFYPGDIIFGKRRFYQRKLAVADFEGICSAHAMVLRAKPDVILPVFLPFFMQSETFFERAMSISVGSLSPTINWSTLQRQEFALPPLDEQRRIAEVLTAVENVTRKYEIVNSSASYTFQRLLDEMLTDSKGWQNLTIQDLVDSKVIAQPQDGNHGNDHPKAKDFTESGIPFIMANDIKNHQIDLKNCKFIPKTLSEQLRIGFSTSGDVLLTHKGTVGETAIVPCITTEYIMLTPQVTYYRVLNEKQLDRNFLYYFFRTSDFQRKLSLLSSQSTRSYIGITAQRKLPISIPPPYEQVKISQTLREFENRNDLLKIHLDYCYTLKKHLLNHFWSS